MHNSGLEQQQQLATRRPESPLKPCSGTKGFRCPCGKAYRSYPALFTHIKQKHDSKPPGIISKPESMTNLKKGRPKGTKNGDSSIYDRKLEKCTGQWAQGSSEMEFLRFLVGAASDLSREVVCKSKKFNIFQNYLKSNRDNEHNKSLTYQEAFIEVLRWVGGKLGPENNVVLGLMLLFGFFCQFVDLYCRLDEGGVESSSNRPSSQAVYFANSFVTNNLRDVLIREQLETCEFFSTATVTKILEFSFKWLYQRQLSNLYLEIKVGTICETKYELV